MEQEVQAPAPDTAPAAQQSAPPPVEIEIVDTPAVAPEAAAAVTPALVFGKYRSLEEAEKAYSESQRAMHEKAQEAATYRKLLDERAAPPPTPQFQQPAVDMDSQFRERLAENPAQVIFQMTQHAAKRMLDDRERVQVERVKQYQALASRPEYASVAQQVASQLPFANEQQRVDPVEMLFMKQRLAQLESMVANGAAASRPATPQFVLPGGAAPRTGANTMRVELDPDTAKLGMSQDKVRELAKMVAKQKNAGGTMNGMSIDDWERANA